jgi:hypothetical protein
VCYLDFGVFELVLTQAGRDIREAKACERLSLGSAGDEASKVSCESLSSVLIPVVLILAPSFLDIPRKGCLERIQVAGFGANLGKSDIVIHSPRNDIFFVDESPDFVANSLC